MANIKNKTSRRGVAKPLKKKLLMVVTFFDTDSGKKFTINFDNYLALGFETQKVIFDCRSLSMSFSLIVCACTKKRSF